MKTEAQLDAEIAAELAKPQARPAKGRKAKPRDLQLEIDYYLARPAPALVQSAPTPTDVDRARMSDDSIRGSTPSGRYLFDESGNPPTPTRATPRPPAPKPRAATPEFSAKKVGAFYDEDKAPAIVTAPTSIKGFPAERVEAAQEALEALQKRLVRAAQRAGQPAPTAPELVVSRPYDVAECTRCRGRDGGAMIGRDHVGCSEAGQDGRYRRRAVVDVSIVAPPPRLDGWEFLAVVEPLEGGNLIKTVPGAAPEGFSFAPWRTGAIRCTHCNTIRQRLETFIVRHDDGRVQQVGRNCLKDFLGGKSAEAILSSLSWMDLVLEAGGADEDGGFSRTHAPVLLDPLEVMAWTASITRISGFVSRKAAGEGKPATADVITSMLGDAPIWNAQALKFWKADRARYKPTPADEAKGAELLTWCRALPGATDYEINIGLIARQSTIKTSHVATLSSAIISFDRERGLATARPGPVDKAASKHVGVIGKRQDFTLTVERIADITTDFGPLHIHTMRDAAGNAVIWKTGSRRLEVGTTVTGGATPKAHTEYRGEKQTELTRFSATTPRDVLVQALNAAEKKGMEAKDPAKKAKFWALKDEAWDALQAYDKART